MKDPGREQALVLLEYHSVEVRHPTWGMILALVQRLASVRDRQVRPKERLRSTTDH